MLFRSIFVPDYDQRITLWHGEHGLFMKIWERREQEKFIIHLSSVVEIDCSMGTAESRWAICCATSAQLADALAETIDDDV